MRRQVGDIEGLSRASYNIQQGEKGKVKGVRDLLGIHIHIDRFDRTRNYFELRLASNTLMNKPHTSSSAAIVFFGCFL